MKILSILKLLLVAFTVSPGVAHTNSSTIRERRSWERVRGGASPRKADYYSENSATEGREGDNEAEYYSKEKSLIYDSREEGKDDDKEVRYLLGGRMGKKKSGRSDNAQKESKKLNHNNGVPSGKKGGKKGDGNAGDESLAPVTFAPAAGPIFLPQSPFPPPP